MQWEVSPTNKLLSFVVNFGCLRQSNTSRKNNTNCVSFCIASIFCSNSLKGKLSSPMKPQKRGALGKKSYIHQILKLDACIWNNIVAAESYNIAMMALYIRLRITVKTEC